MILTQKKNKNKFTFNFQEEGIEYTLIDETVNKTAFIPYEDITNNSHEVSEFNSYFKNNSIYSAVVGILFLTINIIYEKRLWAFIFLITAPTFYFLYRKSKITFKVINTDADMNIYIIKGKQFETINSEIINRRNQYLTENYCTINYENNPESEIQKFQWLKKIGIISKKEYIVIEEEILNN